MAPVLYPSGLPAIGCDITCGQVGCSGFTFGVAEACNVLSPRGSAAAPVAPAPAASQWAIATMVALLAAVGLFRLSRRRA